LFAKKRKNRIILASSSPRRKELLAVLLSNFGLKFRVIPANIAEYIPQKLRNFKGFVINLAYLKASKIAENQRGIIIGADTIVVLKNKVLGKPKSRTDAVRMLKTLSGKEHKVYTGLVIIDNYTKSVYKSSEVTRVKFRKLSNREIVFYVGSGSPMDKAGAYGIQDDFGSTFVEKINGDYFNVVGLPIVKAYSGLRKYLTL
jgi:septum formation protein